MIGLGDEEIAVSVDGNIVNCPEPCRESTRRTGGCEFEDCPIGLISNEHVASCVSGQNQIGRRLASEATDGVGLSPAAAAERDQ
jgi:hypothetical protein